MQELEEGMRNSQTSQPSGLLGAANGYACAATVAGRVN